MKKFTQIALTCFIILSPSVAAAQYYYYADPTVPSNLQNISGSLFGINEATQFNQMLQMNNLSAQRFQNTSQSYGTYQSPQGSSCQTGTVNYLGSCVTPSQGCILKYGQGAQFTTYTATGYIMCDCANGYAWNSARTTCQKQTANSLSSCIAAHGIYASYNSRTGLCSCAQGDIANAYGQCPSGFAPANSPSQPAPSSVSTQTTLVSSSANQVNLPPLFTVSLGIGDTGFEVFKLQTFLASLGIFQGTATSYYGSVTAAAVKKFQAAHGISQVGIVGPQTLAALNATFAKSH